LVTRWTNRARKSPVTVEAGPQLRFAVAAGAVGPVATLDALVARSGVSRGMIVQIEQARTNPSIGMVVNIGDAFGVSITTLLDYARGPAVRIVSAEQAVRLWHTDAGSYNRLLAGTEAPAPWRCGTGS
jgi:DNA-binding XRE family transcriptional regulator